MDSNFGPNETFEDTLDFQIKRLEEKLKDPMLMCNCLLAYDECRKCKLASRLEKLQKARGIK
jgi:hypothetical protein